MNENKNIEELRKYSEIEGTELGEVCEYLCHMSESLSIYMSEELNEAIEKEIADHLEFFQKYAKIVTNIREYDFKELEWIKEKS